MHEIITYYLLNIYEKVLRLYLKETMIMIGFSGAFHTSCTVRLVDMKNKAAGIQNAACNGKTYLSLSCDPCSL